ncbi:protein phosphatase 2C domain-containing protein [Nonomuraea cavernae]|uniref:PPM-type phosphatase domain-containing protein n=1 Tax=Nonomuraea cavernae TaxID=2045107 RepID=A0A917Z698_9ACTN|nr:protein phosphatase 2C domain-containing protein [Nonomuraea cavernae]MCA2185692.1 protein phosphatase 2C domain-containing protein [Nonomuraea cavernae]GGO75929.1 hypothetical protein GCM10012289_52150 [Nonomuraea cavernae]
MLRVVDITQSPGSTSEPTADRVGFSGNIAWVIDGATDFTDERTLPDISNVQWLVNLLDKTLLEIGASNKSTDLNLIFERLGEDTRAALAAIGSQGLRNHPCCSIGLAVFSDRVVRLGRIGDATLIAYQGEQVIGDVSTDFFEHRETQAVRQSQEGQQTEAEIIEAMFARRLEYIRGLHRESVFSGHPEAVFRIHTETFPLDSVDTVLICTDGFARCIDDYKIIKSWADLKVDVHRHGLKEIASRIRKFEAQGQSNPSPTKFKQSDDLAAIILAR